MIDPSSRRRKGALLLAAVAVAAVSFGRPAVAAARIPRPYVQKRYLQLLTGTSVAVAFRKPNVVGNLIVAYVVWDNADPVTIADGAGNSYASAVGPTPTADSLITPSGM